MKFSNQKGLTTFWGISIVLIEAVIVFFIFYILYFFWIENPTPTSNILIVRAVTKEGVAIPNSIDTATWTQYVDEENGFNLQFPLAYQKKSEKITYGTNEGDMITLEEEGGSYFQITIFSVEEDEEIDEAYERLTSIKPTIYQSFEEEVDNHDAIVYRQSPGEAKGDRIFFIGNNKLFETKFNKFNARILATFTFKQSE